MATIALSLAGQAVGGFLGGPIGAVLGRAVGALAGSAVDGALFGEQSSNGAGGADVRLQGSREGGAIPRIYGWNRVAGNVIWATELERLRDQTSGSKGAPASTQKRDTILANFAVALCEGEVSHLGRIWADGQLLDTNGLNIRFYSGSETQQADSLIVAKQGMDNAPAYRGTCYLVFEGLVLNDFGNRLPNITVELCRLVGELEPNIRAVTIIPGATEFGYDPTPRAQLVSKGVTRTENAHLKGNISNWTVSLDDLQTMCPNIQHVALVVAWFGNDLRCAQCQIQPRVEGTEREILDVAWSAGGLTRETAPLVSFGESGPSYGGTPSDASVMAAIADLKARGIKTTLYPIVLMDIAGDNTLPDPYTGMSGQPPYAWRGRITCDPAIARAGSVDKTAIAGQQVTQFVTGNTWNYRRMILHYAQLTADAGGVDAILLGSEMRELTFVRSSATRFPFVDALKTLAGDVRNIVGASTKITYAADWSEYSGCQPADAPGDKFFHLDPLWADENVDAIGIDNYMPISDWRDGSEHADADAGSIYNLSYLESNITSGEGYDWYYASTADRDAQIRSPISDGEHDEPWVWRYKDIKGFWSNQHFNRIDGVRSETPTPWVPRSRPIWLTELGCGAVDKGSNLPSAFSDPKSSENARPYFSNGTPNTLMQRQFLRAHLRHWLPWHPVFDEDDNPQSPNYTGRMLDPDRIYLWTWDARPYPAFPNLKDVWSDGENHINGHWLTGRLGNASTDELIQKMGYDFGVHFKNIEASSPLVQGISVEGVVTLRHALEPLLTGTKLDIYNSPQGLECVQQGVGASRVLRPDDLVGEDSPRIKEKWPASGEAPAQLALSYVDRARDYQEASVTAIATDGTSNLIQSNNIVLDTLAAREFAQNTLNQARQSPKTLEISLPLSESELEIGDVIQLAGRKGAPLVVSQIRDGIFREISAFSNPTSASYGMREDVREVELPIHAGPSQPEVIFAHVPQDPLIGGVTRILAGAFAKPWPGRLLVTDLATGATVDELMYEAPIGELASVLAPGTSRQWHQSDAIDIFLHEGHLASASMMQVLNGVNRLLIEHEDGSWEKIGFEHAELIAPSLYRLDGILRDLWGGGGNAKSVGLGARVMVIDAAVQEQNVDAQKLGQTIRLKVFAGSNDSLGKDYDVELGVEQARPLRPVHGQALRLENGDFVFSWVRRTRWGGDGWGGIDVPLDTPNERYCVEILTGASSVRKLDVAQPNALYTLDDQLVDFGVPVVSFSYEISQVSQVYGAGAPFKGDFNV